MRRLGLLMTSSLLFACAPVPKVIEKEVYVKCPIPDIPKTPKPTIQENATYPQKLKTLLDYLFELEKENEILREVIEQCRKD